MASSERSIVEYFSKNDGHKCGYCKSGSSCSHGMWAHSLSVQEYQSLIDRGWRRSGHYCYKPVMNETCCPAYTIKCDAVQFKLTKSQKKLLKKFNHFLATGEKMTSVSSTKHEDRSVSTDMPPQTTNRLIPSDIVESMEQGLPKDSDVPLITSVKDQKQPLPSTEYREISEASTSSSKTLCSAKAVTAVPLKPSKSKYIRIERRRQTLLSRGLSPEQVHATMLASKLRRMTKEKSLEDFINVKLPENAKHRLEMRLVQSSPPSSLFKKTCSFEWQVYRRYQMAIHKDPPSKCSAEQFNRFLCSSPLQIKIVEVKSREFDKTAKTCGTLFTKYQTKIHRESPEEAEFDSFKSFLIDSPLKLYNSGSDSQGPSYGSFHQQYWLDGRLIAVGVIDILPHGVSSVYFFYDPDYSWLSLGTLSSLREIEFTRSLQRTSPALTNYYMGFYIHSCPKMRYKGNLRPSYLLCPEAYSWHEILEARKLLDQSKYARLNSDPEARDENTEFDLNEVKIITGNKVMLYEQFKRLYDHNEDHPMVKEYAQLVGKYCAYHMWLVQ